LDPFGFPHAGMLEALKMLPISTVLYLKPVSLSIFAFSDIFAGEELSKRTFKTCNFKYIMML
jgi:hypothetical protein